MADSTYTFFVLDCPRSPNLKIGSLTKVAPMFGFQEARKLTSQRRMSPRANAIPVWA